MRAARAAAFFLLVDLGDNVVVFPLGLHHVRLIRTVGRDVHHGATKGEATRHREGDTEVSRLLSLSSHGYICCVLVD